tara:strand:- start:139 stop:492 length:354 start_codon:yes stop_codon:yes gene_type:complete
MIELLYANAIYVAYRLIITAHIVRFFSQYVNYYIAVIIAAQLSFIYDNGLFALLFNAQDIPEIAELIVADILYTLRVLVAWFIVKQIWNVTNNYYVAVFIGAELTFIVDYFIFKGIY